MEVKIEVSFAREGKACVITYDPATQLITKVRVIGREIKMDAVPAEGVLRDLGFEELTLWSENNTLYYKGYREDGERVKGEIRLQNIEEVITGELGLVLEEVLLKPLKQ